MKNQYVADINDYKKYLLIDDLSHYYESVDVCWMLTENDGRRDGRKVSYLFNEEKRHDRKIYDYLKNLVITGIRDVMAIEGGEILSVRKYYKLLSAIDLNDMPELLFLDPDNGIEVKSIPYGKAHSERYIYYCDMKKFIDKGSDLLIYQHYPRVNHGEYHQKRTSEIINKLGDVQVIHFDRGTIDFILVRTMN